MQTATLVISALAFHATVSASPQVSFSEPVSAAVANITKLKTKISVDYDSYMPREAIRITVSIHNPTSIPLEIPNPFWQSSAGFDLMMRTEALPFPNEDGYAHMLPHPRSSVAPRDTEPNIVIQPGALIERTVTGSEAIAGSSSAMPGAVAPSKPGEYRLLYSYDTRSLASFKVVEPRFELISTGKLRLSAGEGERWMSAFVVSIEGRRYIMKSHRFTDLSSRIRLGNDTKVVQHNLALLTPYERIAVVDGPVADLAIVDGSNYRTAIRWREPSGRIVEHAILIDSPKQR